jgi:MoaA/NifB/PqqE/SkfB family radical SAM enzyme
LAAFDRNAECEGDFEQETGGSPMESIYYVLSWACHRKCTHCYEDRFRPYVREALADVVEQAVAAMPRIIENLPDRFTYRDLASPNPDSASGFVERNGRIILAGGEVLVDPVRERVLYPALERLRDRYAAQGGVNVVVQTTGDLVTETILDDLLDRGIWSISISGMDDFHVGMEGAKREPVKERLTRWFEARGMKPSGYQAPNRDWMHEDGPTYSFFGATDDAWIGKIWPRGRAWSNGLSRATVTDNFCNAWSGGLNFLNHRFSGSEVSIDPNGDVFPCCLKTKAPLGNLTEEPLLDILDGLAGHPSLEAISMGHPERMGIVHGWDVPAFLDKSRTQTPDGRPYQNFCIGCDRFHTDVLADVLAELREDRRLRRAATSTARALP